MSPVKNIEYVTDSKGKKTKVVVDIATFGRIQDEIEDLEDALALEKAKKDATGFKKWKDFVKELRA
jgi:hypothetical protein